MVRKTHPYIKTFVQHRRNIMFFNVTKQLAQVFLVYVTKKFETTRGKKRVKTEGNGPSRLLLLLFFLFFFSIFSKFYTKFIIKGDKNLFVEGTNKRTNECFLSLFPFFAKGLFFFVTTNKREKFLFFHSGSINNNNDDIVVSLINKFF